MASYAYTNPPTWFASGKNKDVVFALRKYGWIAKYPNGREEIVIAMKNVPEEFWTEGSVKVENAPEVKPDPIPEVKDETPEVKPEPVPEVKEEEDPVVEEAPKKKSRKKATTEE